MKNSSSKHYPYHNRVISSFLSFVFLSFSFQTKDLIKKMLSANVRERITLAEVMDHPWLQEDATAS